MKHCIHGIARLAGALSLLLASISAHAFCTFFAPDTSTVIESYDAASDRYYSSWSTSLSPGSCDFQENVQAPPPGTTQTALAWSSPSYPTGGALQVCEFRAEGQVEPASFFLTINAAECAALKQPGSGWTFLPPAPRGAVGTPSLAAFEVDPATGQCGSGHVPVYRFVNNGWPARGNHRYVADERVRQEMHARANWVEEGVAFCVLRSQRVPLASMNFPNMSPCPGISPGFGGIDNCPVGWESTGSLQTCVIGSNMPTFQTAVGADAADQGPYTALTGMLSAFGSVVGYAGIGGSTSRSFVQMPDSTPGGGFFVTSADRSAGSASSLRTESPAPIPGTFRPFAAGFEVDMDLVVKYSLFVKQVRAASGDAYVQPILTLVDKQSGKRLELSAGAIGTPLASDFATRDAATGEVMVFASLSPASRLGRSAGLPSLQTSHVFDSDHSWGFGGDFEWRVNRNEAAAVLALARSIDPSLSAEPGDYAFDKFGIKGEVVGDASIGYNLQQMSVSVVRP